MTARPRLDPNAEVFIPGTQWGMEPPFVTLLKDVLYILSTNPVAFYEYMSTITDTLNDTILTDTQLEAVAEAIFEQSTLEPNFTYTGAKMCEYLVKNLRLQPPIKPFSSIINKKTKEVVLARVALLQSPDTSRRVQGTAFFLAELFLMMEIITNDKPTKVYAYRMALQEIMDALLSFPTTDNIKCLAKLLKMIGATIDEFDLERNDEDLKMGMQKIFARIKDIVVQKVIEKGVLYMCVNLLELRASNWGKVPVSSSPHSEHAVAAGGDVPPGAFSDAPVFYDTHGQVITSEEANLDDEFVQQLEEDFKDFIAEDEIGGLETDLSELVIPGDDDDEYLQEPIGAISHDQFENFDPETSKAFEAFLQESQNKPTFGYSSRHWSHAS